ncbi:tetratricopeptide repeat protein [Chroococcidiopsis sp. CCMEE 29]|uniref:tetratricopeptide repeat protein n=1 Tax=Chroococcidiopsis sp. CCMEE 29 TaxID=155894 RepID=UPI00201FE7E1|nr:tetratricopeptide repeat protein [Chroococcidiopsis sp. CCMEE 29]
MKGAKKLLSRIFGLGAAAILCPAILYSVAKAQENSDCYIVDPSGQVKDLSGLCSPNTEGQESIPMASAEEFFQRGREFDSQGQSQEAIAEYTRAIQLDSNYVEAYFYRSNLLALEGQPQKAIEDAKRAAAILESKGESQWAAAMRQHEEVIRQGIRDGEF